MKVTISGQSTVSGKDREIRDKSVVFVILVTIINVNYTISKT